MDKSFQLRSEAARIKSYLGTLREQRDEARGRFNELESLLYDEMEAVRELMDEADTMDGKQPRKAAAGGSKPCAECGVPKDLEEFQRHSFSADGRVGTCRDCLKARRESKKAEEREAAVAS